MSTREQYAHATPSFRRQSEHPTRSSSSYGGAHFRRPQVSNSPSSSAVVSYGTIPGNTNRMDSPSRAGPASEKTSPPLEGPTHFGELRYQDTAKTACHATINGSIDKFFIADDRWTCYRRNYFSCVCSFSLGPYFPGTPVEVKPAGGQSFFLVHQFGVSISAVVAGNEQQVVELVQHTPKRDKGPTAPPSIMPLMAKQDVINLGYFNLEDSSIPARNYPDAWVPSEAGGIGTLTEWTFERIQFKQATQNNGKRRAQQQFYHLLVELWVNISPSNNPDWHKVVHRKSAQLIVRGRSPGHYQTERSHSRDGTRNTDNQPAIYGAPMGGPRGYGGAQIHSFGSYDASHGLYDPNQRHHQQQQHHALSREAMLPAEEEKPMDVAKHYTYYPGAMDGSYQSHNTTEPWVGHHDPESVSHMIAGVDINSKVKHEYENITLPRLVHPPSLSNNNDQNRPCRTFYGRSSSNGSYPQLLSPTSVNMSL
ncbi:Meiosis-specific transcription factor-like protein [Emericellopsis cladophorae]|uniref:Meiosis-specific transcription factor-like protein n=1 Tax=Emericellopsis cladophorae TaxID=2686198 RepID=A0A9P9Y979_9HYPO|nr:Meiosis-specific transcription factor-like protein [Emericellopsis cladophorae]KAI6785310.1 Meiosis-specific transcription factor-like protein [Emericellopsis cladophorae]